MKMDICFLLLIISFTLAYPYVKIFICFKCMNIHF
nr:MAG TPA: hypothetical protein [Caudoviricetes sp.]